MLPRLCFMMKIFIICYNRYSKIIKFYIFRFIAALALSTECNAALGFENGNVTDDQLSASSPWQAAHQARLNVGGEGILQRKSRLSLILSTICWKQLIKSGCPYT